MPSILEKVRSILPREGPGELGKEFEEELEECKKQTEEAKEEKGEETVKSKGNKCDVCQKPLHAELLGGNFGGKCRICQRSCCSAHYKDGLCPYCKEKLGAAKPGEVTKSSIF